MEHLVSFGYSTPIKVPYVCQRTFSGSIFDYPERQGWSREALYKGNFEGHTFEETRGLLQEWLFFGLLFHAFDTPGMDFRMEDFVRRDDDGKEWVTTEKLPMYAKKWFFQSNGPYYTKAMRPEQERRADFQHLYPALREICRFVQRYCDISTYNERVYPKPTFWPLTPELSLSIIVLCDSITKMGFEGTCLNFNLSFGNSKLLYDRMIAAGWCPSVLSHLTTTQSIGLMYSSETLGSPPTVKVHSDCNEWLCKHNQVDEVNYKTQHVFDDCDCKFVGPPLKEIIEILQNGGIPLVQCHEDGDILDIKVSQYTPDSIGTEYVAISHIWSDGLGNPFKNELPSCQLRRLQRLVNDVVQDSESATCAWWCDTLCVPVASDLREFRKTAIQRMAGTYKGASRVLVLDSDLLKVSKQCSVLELYIRFRLSNWMRRLWTLQEGFLGKLVVLQLKDGTIDLSRLDKEMLQTEVTTRRCVYTRYSFISHTELGTFLRQATHRVTNQPNSQHLRLESLWKQLEYRATSKQSDETICLGTMVGLSEKDLAGLLQLGESDFGGRMIHFLRSLDGINITILYQPPPRLQISGFRWAPTSFLSYFRGAKTLPYRAMRGTAQIGPGGRGLLFKSEGLIMEEKGEALPLIGNDFHLQLPEQSQALLRLSYVGTIADTHTDRKATNVDGSRNLKQPAVIICQKLYSIHIVDGALVDIVEITKERITCNFIAWVGLVRASETNFPTEGIKLTHTGLQSEDQEWLVL